MGTESDQRLLTLARELLGDAEAEVQAGDAFLTEDERRSAVFAGFVRRIEDHPEGEALKAALRRLSDH